MGKTCDFYRLLISHLLAGELHVGNRWQRHGLRTRTKWGKFKPWLLLGSISTSIVLYLAFNTIQRIEEG